MLTNDSNVYVVMSGKIHCPSPIGYNWPWTPTTHQPQCSLLTSVTHSVEY
jgi:hypothetical protein